MPLKESEVSKRWAGARLTDSHRNPTERFLTQGVNSFMRISEILTQQDLQTLISLLQDFLASHSRSQEKGLAQPMNEAICSLSLPEPKAGCCAKVRVCREWYAYYFTPEDKERLKNVFGILGITRNYQVYFLHSDMFWDT